MRLNNDSAMASVCFTLTGENPRILKERLLNRLRKDLPVLITILINETFAQALMLQGKLCIHHKVEATYLLLTVRSVIIQMDT